VTPEQASHETRDAIAAWAGEFIQQSATFARGAELGFEGMDFYVGGRGGVLGDVPADVVVAVFTFFGTDLIRDAWNRAGTVMLRSEAGRAWAEAAHAWARMLPDTVDWARLAELSGRVVANAPVQGAPLFAGWRTLAEPDDAPALAVHRMNALRELRGALHGSATLTVGLTPADAVAAFNARLLPVLGWPAAHGDLAPLKERWQLAEARTDRMFGRHLGVLESDEREEFVEICKALPE
jgi:hypothetical protein